MITQETQSKRLVMVRVNPGEDLLEAIREAVDERQISNGAILSGAGSLSRYRVHVVKTTSLPPGDVFFEEEGPFDILTLTGVVINGRVHAHITLSNTDKAMGGHLEEGCTVLTFAMLTIADTPSADLSGWDAVQSL